MPEADRPGAGAPFRLDDVGAGPVQIHRQLLLLIQRQQVGNRHGQDHPRQQGPGAVGEIEHLSGS